MTPQTRSAERGHSTGTRPKPSKSTLKPPALLWCSLVFHAGMLQRENDQGKGKDTREQAERLVRARNSMFGIPLSESRLKDLFNDESLKYTPGCNAVRSRLPWVGKERVCWRCQRTETHCLSNVLNAQEKGLDPISLAVVYNISATGETSPTKIAAAINMKDYRAVQAAMKRIIAAGCWPDNAPLPASNAGGNIDPKASKCDSSS